MTTLTSPEHASTLGRLNQLAVAWLARIPVRNTLSDVAQAIAWLALVIALIVARFLTYAGGMYAPPSAGTWALGAGVVSLLAFVASAWARKD